MKRKRMTHLVSFRISVGARARIYYENCTEFPVRSYNTDQCSNDKREKGKEKEERGEQERKIKEVELKSARIKLNQT